MNEDEFRSVVNEIDPGLQTMTRNWLESNGLFTSDLQVDLLVTSFENRFEEALVKP